MNRLFHPMVRTVIAGAMTLLIGGCMAVAPQGTAAPASEAASAPAEGTLSYRESYSELPAAESAAPASPSRAGGIDSYTPESRARERSEWAASGGAASTSSEYAFEERPRSYGDHSVQFAPVTAGVVDDNEQWREYLDYRQRNQGLWVNDRNITQRHIIRVWDERARPIHDANVDVFSGSQWLFAGKTDAGGRLLFHPAALESAGQGATQQSQQSRGYRLVVSKGQVTTSQEFSQSDDQWAVTLANAPHDGQTRLDLMFVIDATGSMSDEIAKLKASIADVADQIAKLPEQPEVRYGLVAYRDEGDEFVTRVYGFTDKLGEFQGALSPCARTAAATRRKRSTRRCTVRSSMSNGATKRRCAS
ncbi:MAG: VWA domain-containing protein [Caldilineaceae bacterium]|nr:VWA domain-containing protein [Caldilineaceae bacterium]